MKSKTSLNREMSGNVVIDETNEGNVELIFLGSISVAGQVLADSQGLPDFKIDAIPYDPSLPIVQSRTIRDGAYLLAGLSEGNYLVEIPMHNFTQNIMVNRKSNFDFLVHANRLSGYVSGDGSLKGAEIRLSSRTEDEKVSLRTKVREDGSYLLKGIPNGSYTLQITHAGEVRISQRVETFDEHVNLDFKLDEVLYELED